MALVLGTKLKFDGKEFEEGTPLSKLPKGVRDHVKAVGALREEAPEPEPEDEEEEEDEAEDQEAESES